MTDIGYIYEPSGFDSAKMKTVLKIQAERFVIM